MIQIKNCNVTVMVSDLDQSIGFYTEILGMKLKARYGNHWADIEGPGISLGLHPTDQNIHPAKNLSIALGVENLDLAVARLAEKGVKCSISDDDGKIKLAHFADPDGNALYLVQSQW